MKDKRHTALKGSGNQLPASSLGIWGSGCSFLKEWANNLADQLSGRFSIAYLDENHPGTSAADAGLPFAYDGGSGAPSLHSNNPLLHSYQQTSWPLLHEMVFFNGHHVKGSAHWLVWDGKKSFPQDSPLLESTVLFTAPKALEKEAEEFRRNHSALKQIPFISIENKAGLTAWLQDWILQNRPPVKALILAGGSSSRMGKDKATLNLHGLPQVQYLAALLSELKIETLVSCQSSREEEFSVMGLAVLPDTFIGLGPVGGILSAFRHDPEAAWLVLACDLPNLDAGVIRHLLENRSPRFLASALQASSSDFPEPLACIWEPAAYPVLLMRLARGLSCPSKALKELPCHRIPVPDDAWVANMNTPEDMDKILNRTI
jgi:molybdopterin-guanine dinucleotide biosynthesis protein A